MKKFLATILVVSIIVSFIACKNKNDVKGDDGSVVNSNIQQNNGSSQESNIQQNSSTTGNSNAQLAIGAQIKYNEGKSDPRSFANTYKCLTEQKKLDIVYIGGSVTNGRGSSFGSSWRELTTKWFRENYKTATINETNAAIGGTSSMWGLARLEKDVLSKNPDLVFIEFAVNDSYAGFTEMQSAVFMDAMIRRINEYNSKTDIVIVFVTDNSKREKEYINVKGHRTVAEYYGIPCVDAGKALINEMNSSGKAWEYYFTDSVHPGDEGYKVYAAEVRKTLEALLQKATTASAVEHKLSDKAATTSVLKKLIAVEVEKVKYDSNWLYREKAKVSIGNKSELGARKQGATVTYEFEGSVVGCIYNAKKNGNIKVSIDGGNEKTFSLSGDTSGCIERVFYDNLNSGKHTLKIEYIGTGYFALGALLVG